MNFYERHLGDYAKDTAHLTMLEHGAYTLLLDRYYATEQGIPADQTHRVARARTKEEKEAVDIVLEEFFKLVDGVYIKGRVEEEIASYLERVPAAEERKKSAKERQQRARERRREMFEELASHGVVMPWNTKTEALQAELSRVTSQDNRAPVTLPVTRDDTANQSPYPSPHIKKHKAAASTPPPELREADLPAALPEDGKDPVHLRAIELTTLLRQRGAALQASDPRLRRWAAEGVTDAQALQALELAQQRRETAGSAAAINAGYLDTILADVTTDRPAAKAGSRPVVDDWHRTDAGIERKGRELGLFAHGGESYGSYRDRIWQRIRELENQPETEQ